jgi:hypothetical protein
LAYTNLDDTGKELPLGQIKLLNIADFYGIDCPEVTSSRAVAKTMEPDPPPPTEKEIEDGAELARQFRAQEANNTKRK